MTLAGEIVEMAVIVSRLSKPLRRHHVVAFCSEHDDGGLPAVAACPTCIEFEVARFLTLRPISEYHEDHGTVLWWHLPIQEPPYVGAGPGMDDRDRNGNPTACARLLAGGWLTHWSPIPQPSIQKPQEQGAERHSAPDGGV